MSLPGARRRSVAGEVTSSFRVMLAASACVIALTVSLLTWVTVFSNPQLSSVGRLIASVEDAHSGLVDQETGLRAYVVTGQTSFLGPYTVGLKTVQDADVAMQSTHVSGQLAGDMLNFRVAQQRWSDGWAVIARDPATRAALLEPDGGPNLARTAELFSQGKTLMDAYRVTEQQLIKHARAQGTATRARQRTALLWFCLATLLIVAVAFASALRRRAMLRSRVVGPIAVMLRTVKAVASGDLRAPPIVDGPADLTGLRDGIAEMTVALAQERDVNEAARLAAQRNTVRLHQVLAFAREVSGSLSLRYVLDALTTAATTLTGADNARVWLTSEDDLSLHLAADAKSGRKGAPAAETREIGFGTVGRAAQYARICSSDDADAGVSEAAADRVIALQLTVGARLMGVLELVGSHSDELEEALTLVETVTGHAATAIEAARLYQEAQVLSVSDSLTGLANRRRLDDDLRLEVDRAIRYARPVGLIMIDLDNFKALNDKFGHPRGDVVLQQVAQILSNTVRSCDTVYRYGGEEIAVIVRETDLRGAQDLAERLRLAVELRFTRPDGPAVTLSAGVAAVPEHAATPAGLIASADAALYASKTAGRNRTSVATG